MAVLFYMHIRYFEIDDKFFECKLGAGISPELKFEFFEDVRSTVCLNLEFSAHHPLESNAPPRSHLVFVV